jgi:hypothetical protein
MATIAEAGVGVMTKRDNIPVRLGIEAVDIAKKAAALKGLTLADYATDVLLEAANRDLDEFSRARVQATRRTRKGKAEEGGE